jgi:hypothetical protein
MPSLGPLFPVVLGFIELPVVVELAAGPPAAELPPADDPAPEPALCANAAPEAAIAANNAIAATLIWRSSITFYNDRNDKGLSAFLKNFG